MWPRGFVDDVDDVSIGASAGISERTPLDERSSAGTIDHNRANPY
jgi:hypothetical protein